MYVEREVRQIQQAVIRYDISPQRRSRATVDSSNLSTGPVHNTLQLVVRGTADAQQLSMAIDDRVTNDEDNEVSTVSCSQLTFVLFVTVMDMFILVCYI